MIHYRCYSCGKELETGDLIYRCPSCTGGSETTEAVGFQRGNLQVLLDLDKASEAVFPDGHIHPLWLLPYSDNMGNYKPDLSLDKLQQCFPGGNTPMVQPKSLRKRFPALHCKLEGANPSGSLKDRASLLVAAQALNLGEKRVVLASTGNAGSAMSCAGAALGLEVILFVPAAAPEAKLAQSVFYGAHVVPIEGSYDDAFALSLEYSRQFGGINRNTAYNPLTIEGKKTCALEIYNQLGTRSPDLIYIPTGDGVIYTGICKGFEDLLAMGLIDRMPRCIAVQSRGSNAIHQSFTQGRELSLTSASTLADSISVCSPACGEPAIHYLKLTKGWTVEVTDQQILQAQGELARSAGIFVEPSSAAAWAGIQEDLEARRITGQEEAVLLLTGTGFKDMGAVNRQIQIPRAVECSLKAVMDYLSPEQ